MTDEWIDGGVEALLILATEPVAEEALAEALDVPVDRVRDSLSRLVAFYDATGRGFELRRVGGGWRYYTRAQYAPQIAASLMDPQQSRLSQAGLETLAVIAYLQPVSRGRISSVRGVAADGVVRTLIARGLVEETGRDEATGAGLLGTTDHFLERMGLAALGELPPLAPNLPDAGLLDDELRRLAEPAGQADGAAEPGDKDEPEAGDDDE